MPVPSNISELSPIPAQNSPAGSESATTMDDYLRTHAAFIAQMRDGNKSAIDALTAHQQATDPHAQYIDQQRGDVRYVQLSQASEFNRLENAL